MNTQTKAELVLQATNFANNILVQALSNYGDVSEDGRKNLQRALVELQDAEREYRKVD